MGTLIGCKKDSNSNYNVKPTVEFLSPLGHTTIQQHETIEIIANAYDTDGEIVHILFYVNDKLEFTDSEKPYNFQTSFGETGQNSLLIKAMDNSDAMATDGPIYISVTQQNNPSVSISYTPNYSIKELDDIDFTVSANSPNGPIESVKFFINGSLFGTDTLQPYKFSWNSVPAGDHTVYAIASDINGTTSQSNDYNIFVKANTPPSIEFYYPNQGQEFSPGETVRIYVSSHDNDGQVEMIELYANGLLIETLIDENEYDWEGVTSGNYTLTAVAYDDNGASTSSEEIEIKVLPGIITNGIISDLVYSESDDLVFGINQTRNKLLFINPNERNMTEIDLPYSQPIAMKYSISDKKLYIIYKFSGIISVWDNITQSLSTMNFSSSGDGLDISIDPQNRKIYILATTGLYILNMNTGDILLDGASIEGVSMALDPIGESIFTASYGGSPARVYKYSLSDDNISLQQTTYELGSNPRNININPNFNFLVLPCGGGNGPGYTLYAIDTDNLDNILGEFDIGTYPTYANFSVDGNTLFGTNGDPYDNFIYVIDANNYTQMDKINFPNSDDYSVLTPNYSGNKIVAFSYDNNQNNNYTIYFFDLQ